MDVFEVDLLALKAEEGYDCEALVEQFVLLPWRDSERLQWLRLDTTLFCALVALRAEDSRT